VPATSEQNSLKRAKLAFCGLQQHFITGEIMPLWTVLDELDCFCRGSTVAARSLLVRGFFVPHHDGWESGDVYDPCQNQ
jgi:hypothetical protein